MGTEIKVKNIKMGKNILFGLAAIGLVGGIIYLSRTHAGKTYSQEISDYSQPTSQVASISATSTNTAKNLEGVVNPDGTYSSRIDGKTYGFTNKIVNGKMRKVLCEIKR